MNTSTGIWETLLRDLTSKHDVVGASLAVQHKGDEIQAVAGILNARTGQPVTPDSVFQVGSITKIWTATQIMMLVDEGRIDLDAPIRDLLPSFAVADPTVSSQVTPRHLLAHTSGIDGDLFIDTGRGDDAVRRYVEAMQQLEQNHPMGALFSYCNAGYALLSHLVAELRGASWETTLRTDLLDPLDAARAGAFPEEAILHAPAVGHYWDPVGHTPVVTPHWALFRGISGAGLLHSTPAEQIRFAQLHLDQGGGLISPAAVTEMQTQQVELPDPSQGTGWGLGWALDNWGGARVLFHDGETGSQSAFLAVLPDHDLIVALCTNGGRAPTDLWRDLSTRLAEELTGVRRPPPPKPPSDPSPLSADQFEGTYRRAGFDAVIGRRDGELKLTLTPTGALAGLLQEREMELVGSERTSELLGRGPDETNWQPVVFLEHEDQRYLHAGALAFRYVGAPPTFNA